LEEHNVDEAFSDINFRTGIWISQKSFHVRNTISYHLAALEHQNGVFITEL